MVIYKNKKYVNKSYLQQEKLIIIIVDNRNIVYRHIFPYSLYIYQFNSVKSNEENNICYNISNNNKFWNSLICYI